MATVAEPVSWRRGRPITMEEFFALPDDGVRRWVINGELREERTEDGMTVRNPFHSLTLANVVGELRAWVRAQPTVPGHVLVGDAGFLLSAQPRVLVGCDAAYLTAEQLRRAMPGDAGCLHVAPLLVVEVESPSNTVEDMNEKLTAYLEAGVQIVWQINPKLRTVTIYRPDGDHQMVNRRGELTAEPHLPGFRCRVADLFYPA